MVIVCAFIPGCTGDEISTPSSPDEQVLAALDFYDPVYRLDSDGRVNNLRLDGRHLPDAMMAEVGKLSELEVLSMYGASFSDSGLGHLEGLQKLRMLGIGSTPITDKALVHIEKLESLTHIWLPQSRLSPAALEKLKNARPGLNVFAQ